MNRALLRRVKRMEHEAYRESDEAVILVCEGCRLVNNELIPITEADLKHWENINATLIEVEEDDMGL